MDPAATGALGRASSTDKPQKRPRWAFGTLSASGHEPETRRPAAAPSSSSSSTSSSSSSSHDYSCGDLVTFGPVLAPICQECGLHNNADDRFNGMVSARCGRRVHRHCILRHQSRCAECQAGAVAELVDNSTTTMHAVDQASDSLGVVLESYTCDRCGIQIFSGTVKTTCWTCTQDVPQPTSASSPLTPPFQVRGSSSRQKP